jgi:hypothetical protein
LPRKGGAVVTCKARVSEYCPGRHPLPRLRSGTLADE